MADLVKYQLDDETEVLFESAEADLVSIPIADCRQLSGRLELAAKTAKQIAEPIQTDGYMMRSLSAERQDPR